LIIRGKISIKMNLLDLVKA